MAGQVTLFDLPSKDGNLCWSLNPWKTRAVLNFKSIPYKTEWVEFPEIKTVLSARGIPPADTSKGFAYTIPAVGLPDGRSVMDSRPIADELEKLQPEPSLRLDNGYTDRAQGAVGKTIVPLLPEILPKVPKVLLTDASVGYFEETRKAAFGMSLSAFGQSEKSGEAAWQGAEEGLKELKSLLNEDASGPFVEGQVPSYADIIIASFLEFTQRTDIAVFERITGFDESFKQLHEAAKPWLQRNSH